MSFLPVVDEQQVGPCHDSPCEQKLDDCRDVTSHVQGTLERLIDKDEDRWHEHEQVEDDVEKIVEVVASCPPWGEEPVGEQRMVLTPHVLIVDVEAGYPE